MPSFLIYESIYRKEKKGLSENYFITDSSFFIKKGRGIEPGPFFDRIYIVEVYILWIILTLERSFYQ